MDPIDFEPECDNMGSGQRTNQVKVLGSLTGGCKCLDFLKCLCMFDLCSLLSEEIVLFYSSVSVHRRSLSPVAASAWMEA